MKSPREPQYLRLQNDLRLLIAKGVYNEGDKLPSENELCAEYGITRMTVRTALQGLEQKGLIHKRKGFGAIVNSRRKGLELLSVKGFTEVMRGEQVKVQTKIISKPTRMKWKKDFFFELTEREMKAGCIRMERLRQMDHHPVMVEITYIPDMNLKGFFSKPFINDSLFDTLHISYGIQISKVIQHFRAVEAKGTYAMLLKAKKGKAILHIVRKLVTNLPDFNIYSFVYFDSEHYSIVL